MNRLLKLLAWTAGGLLVLGLLVAAVGWQLPVEHTATVERRVQGTPEEVWAVITDVEGMPEWRPGVESVEPLGVQGAAPTWRESGPAGAMTLRVAVWAPPTRMVTRIVDEDLPFGGSWTYALEPTDGGTRVTLTEDGEIYNPVFRFVARFILGYDATMIAYLDALESHMAGAGG